MPQGIAIFGNKTKKEGSGGEITCIYTSYEN